MSNLLATLIFSCIGAAAFMYGKRQVSWRPMLIGVVLMLYGYLVSNPLAVYGIGVGLTVLLFVWRD